MSDATVMLAAIEGGDSRALTLSGNVPEPLLCRRVAEPMDGVDHAQARPGASQLEQKDYGHPG